MPVQKGIGGNVPQKGVALPPLLKLVNSFLSKAHIARADDTADASTHSTHFGPAEIHQAFREKLGLGLECPLPEVTT
jgi:hypothetical protein